MLQNNAPQFQSNSHICNVGTADQAAIDLSCITPQIHMAIERLTESVAQVRTRQDDTIQIFRLDFRAHIDSIAEATNTREKIIIERMSSADYQNGETVIAEEEDEEEAEEQTVPTHVINVVPPTPIQDVRVSTTLFDTAPAEVLTRVSQPQALMEW